MWPLLFLHYLMMAIVLTLHFEKSFFYNNRLWKRYHFEDFHKFVLTSLWKYFTHFSQIGSCWSFETSDDIECPKLEEQFYEELGLFIILRKRFLIPARLCWFQIKKGWTMPYWSVWTFWGLAYRTLWGLIKVME